MTTDVRSHLRSALRARRAAIPVTARIAAANSVAEQLLRLPAMLGANTVAGYWAVGGELPLHSVVTRLGAQTRYCLPVLRSGHTLQFAPWRIGDAVVANRYGIPEPANGEGLLDPATLDVVLLPLLGYTRNGDRLGTGGGWYDRSFAFRRYAAAPPLLVGIGFACQQIDAVEAASMQAQPWDVPLDAIVTERELLQCRG